MPDTSEKRQNWAVWAGFLLALGAVLCNVVFFFNLSGGRAIPWLSVLLSVVTLVFLGFGLKRAFGRPPVYRGKILSSILSWLSLLLVGVAIFASFSARAISTSAVLRKNLRWTESARVPLQMAVAFCVPAPKRLVE